MGKPEEKSGAGRGGELPVAEHGCARVVGISDFLGVSTGFVHITLLK